MSLEAGQLIGDSAEFVSSDCMARFMEDALLQLMPPADEEDSGRLGRRQFLIAISRGLIEYLRTHDDTNYFRVTVSDGGNVLQGELEIL